MTFNFTAKIYKVGINPCVKVPFRITEKMHPIKGYIPVKGTINDHPFTQTLTPVKDDKYRLHVNGIMLKGSGLKLGDTANFSIEQDFTPQEKAHPMSKELKKALTGNKLMDAFNQLTPYRQKEITRYLNNLKTEEASKRNIDKVIAQLKKK